MKRKIVFMLLLLVPVIIMCILTIYDQVYYNVITQEMWVAIIVAFISYWGAAVVGYCTFLNSEHIRFIEDTKLVKENLPEFHFGEFRWSLPANTFLRNAGEAKKIFWNRGWDEIISEYVEGVFFKNQQYWLETIFERDENVPMYNILVATATEKSKDKMVKVSRLERRKEGNLYIAVPFDINEIPSWKVFHNECNICFSNMYGQNFYQRVKIDVLVCKEGVKFYSAISDVRPGKKKVCIKCKVLDETSKQNELEKNVLATMYTRNL